MNLDRRQFFGAGALLLAARHVAAPRFPGPRPAHPHASLYLYTLPLFRPRHQAIVQAALHKRADNHTSGWLKEAGKPVLAVGPVGENAGFWHGQKLVKNIYRTWPFVAVLEYDGNGKPEAFIDWFRRPRGSSTPDGWLRDPGIDYADHINKEMVTSQDADWHYMAVPDTPTDDHVGTSEFVIRGRVRWQNGQRAQLGWWIWFDAPKGHNVTDWSVAQIPLVDWCVSKTSPKLGAVATAAVDDPDHELAVWGERTVFTFPAMPPGLQPGR
jgi:hypothetical protein